MDVTDFLEKEFSETSLYMLYRAMPNAVSGLKDGAAKLVYTALNQMDSKLVKVAALAGQVQVYSNYLHGNASMEGTITTAGQSYAGSNNLPLLESQGNFGTRFVNEPSASRYVFARKPRYFDFLFRKEDEPNLEYQHFEGQRIQPKQYYPVVPLHLVNGVSGIGSGWKCDILARPLENVIRIIRNRLSGRKWDPALEIPGWNGFSGKVSRCSVPKDPDSMRWEIQGEYKKTGNILEITELPVHIQLTEYLDLLRSLKDKGLIQKYDDLSQDDRFHFIVRLSKEETSKSPDKLEKDFKLVTYETEHLNCEDADRKVVEFKTVEEMFEHYFQEKMASLEKRKASEMARLEKELGILSQVYRFLIGVVKKKYKVTMKRKELEAVLVKDGFTIIDKLLSMPISALTEEKVEEARKAIEKKTLELESMRKQTSKSLWLKDLNELEKAVG